MFTFGGLIAGGSTVTGGGSTVTGGGAPGAGDTVTVPGGTTVVSVPGGTLTTVVSLGDVVVVVVVVEVVPASSPSPQATNPPVPIAAAAMMASVIRCVMSAPLRTRSFPAPAELARQPASKPHGADKACGSLPAQSLQPHSPCS